MEQEESGAPWYWRPVNLFDRTEPDVRREFFARSAVREYARGEHVFLADDAAERGFYLLDGMVKIEHISPAGQSTIFWFCVPGDLFGAGGITGSVRQSVYARATEPSRALVLQRRQFEALILAYPVLGLNVIRLMGSRLRLACDSMAEVSQRASLRVGRVILRLAESCGQWTDQREVALKARISHQEIADMVGCTRQTVTEVLQGICQRGILRVEKRIIHICDIDQLRQCVEEAEFHDGGNLFPQ